MRKEIVSLSVLIFCFSTFSQVLNTGQTMRLGSFSLTASPLAYFDNGSLPDPGFHAMFGIGLPGKLDLSFNANFRHGRNPLFGADIEWGILSGFPSFSFTTGIHGFNYAGIDLTANLTFPIRQVAAIYGGFDSDIDFADSRVRIPVWGFGGVEVSIKRAFKIMMELDIAASKPAQHIMAIGIALFF
ncbi:MAG TPA: hypothetical protein PLE24_04250 [Chitinispirillaceae bacterium]|jgi:hypothetical protein|nr:hypothetical protein [Chitinispirillaceae bacterium]